MEVSQCTLHPPSILLHILYGIFVFHIVIVEVEEKPPSAKKVKKEKKKKIRIEQPAEEEVIKE